MIDYINLLKTLLFITFHTWLICCIAHLVVVVRRPRRATSRGAENVLLVLIFLTFNVSFLAHADPSFRHGFVFSLCYFLPIMFWKKCVKYMLPHMFDLSFAPSIAPHAAAESNVREPNSSYATPSLVPRLPHKQECCQEYIGRSFIEPVRIFYICML